MGNSERSAVVRCLPAAFAATVLLLVAVTTAAAQTNVTASWDRNADPSTNGYRLYYGTAPGAYQWSIDAGNQVSASLNLSSGRYYFSVRAYNASYEYGPPSAEVSIDMGTTAPAPTAAIQASLQSPGVALVAWQTSNATSATINGTSVPLSGSSTVSVAATTTFTLTAANAAGATATASATVQITTTTSTPLPPTNMAASVAGSRVTLSWRAPSGGSPPQDYLLDVGTRSGASNISRGYAVGNVLSVSGDLPRGKYYARVRARNAAGTSGDSNQVSFRIGTQLASPTGFVVTWQGTEATLAWSAPSADGLNASANEYVLEAGSGPGLADIASLRLGNATRFTVNVPAGVYYVRVRAVSASGDSDPTPDLVVAPPGTAQAPAGLVASGTASTVTLSWRAPAGSEAPSGYQIEAGTEPGLSNLAAIRVANVTQFTTVAPPGTYFVRVRAINSRGPGIASNEVVIQR